ncbi:MAG TPA: peptidase S8, partial [Bacteroidetes bacterium]|nr:peptidase S8 [Bacteroidota bacterium]
MKYNGSFVIALFTIGIILLFYPYNNCLANNDRTSNADTSVLNNDFIKGELIMKFKQEAGKISPKLTAGIASVGISSVDAIFNRAGATQIKKVFKNKQPPVNKTLPDLSKIFYLKIPLNADVQSIARELSQNPNIEYAEPRYIYKMYDVPDDPLYSDQWYLPKINASDAWDISQGDADVVIGIIDTGVDWTHPDLAENMWTNAGETGLDAQGNNKRTNGIDDDNNGYIDDWNGWDFCGDDGYTPDNDPMDTHGHGTHCSGMASAVTNNEIGVAGLGRNCRIMPIRVIYYTTLLYGPEGIVYAADNGCDIVNLSWGGDPPSSFLNDAIQYAHQSGTFVIAAAGNDDTSEKKYPASYANVLSVAATDENDTKADFSSYGSSIDVSAPGNHMLSAMLDDSYAYMSGTSMAAPLVAGLAGLIKSQNPNWTNVQIANQILMSADNIDELNPQFIGMLGSGRINALNALTYEATPIITYQDFTIDEISTLHKVYFYLNITADGGYNTLDTFLVIIGKPNVLLVDDDCDGNNVEEYYTKTLDSLGIAYDYWQHSSKGSPSVNILAGYSVIIWFTEASFPSLNTDDIDNLTSYLNNGGNLFLTGQDIGWDFNDPE